MMGLCFFRSLFFILFFVYSSGQLQNKKIVQSFYSQTCLFLNYKCNNSESGVLKLRALSLDCLPLNHEYPNNCSRLELVAYQDIICSDNYSHIRVVSKNGFQECKDTDRELNVTSEMGLRHNCSFLIPDESLYMLELSLNGTALSKGESWEFSWRSKHGFLPPAFWPLLIFYQVSLSLYSLYFVLWLMFCCYFYKELLQLQYYIAFIIFLGLLEKIIFVVEFEYFNRFGEEVAFSTLVFGELVSALKRSAARILVIVVSVGFGIVKPRLGRTLYPLVIAGLGYFVLSGAQGMNHRENKGLQKQGLQAVLALGLSFMDALFFYWILHSLIKTMRTLRLRKNDVKLSVYKHFTNTLVFALIASLAFSIWSLSNLLIGDCIKQWRELWLDEAFWPFLFSILLFMIMILWRPSSSNLRYAYSPLNDGDDEDDDDESREPMMNDAFDGIKLRSKSEVETSANHNQDDPLKWIEENLPRAANSAVPSSMLGDDEVEETLFEINKLQ